MERSIGERPGASGQGLEALVALAQRAQEAATAVRAHARALHDVGDLPWRGPAAQAFAARLQTECDDAARVASLLVVVADRAHELHARAAVRAALLADQAQALGAWYAEVPVPTYGAFSTPGAQS